MLRTQELDEVKAPLISPDSDLEKQNSNAQRYPTYKRILSVLNSLKTQRESSVKKLIAMRYSPTVVGSLAFIASLATYLYYHPIFEAACTGEIRDQFNNSTGIWPNDVPFDVSNTIPPNITCGTTFNIENICTTRVLSGKAFAWDCLEVAVDLLRTNGSLSTYNIATIMLGQRDSTTCGIVHPLNSLSQFYTLVGYAVYICKNSLDEIVKASDDQNYFNYYTLFHVGLVLSLIALGTICLFYTCIISLCSKPKPSLRNITDEIAEEALTLSKEHNINIKLNTAVVDVLNEFEKLREKRLRYITLGDLLYAHKNSNSALGNFGKRDTSKDCLRLILNHAELTKNPEENNITQQKKNKDKPKNYEERRKEHKEKQARIIAFLSAGYKNNGNYKYNGIPLCSFFARAGNEKKVLAAKILRDAGLMPPKRRPYNGTY